MDNSYLIKKAYELGARCFIVERVTEELKSNQKLRYIHVKDTALAEVKLLNAASGYP